MRFATNKGWIRMVFCEALGLGGVLGSCSQAFFRVTAFCSCPLASSDLSRHPARGLRVQSWHRFISLCWTPLVDLLCVAVDSIQDRALIND